uniref:(northern house mosquito) hypothetical protein n=1 Tax=Culex pipiens TaxID=7175 RepID=A0A8D8II07_CULPI
MKVNTRCISARMKINPSSSQTMCTVLLWFIRRKYRWYSISTWTFLNLCEQMMPLKRHLTWFQHRELSQTGSLAPGVVPPPPPLWLPLLSGSSSSGAAAP